MYGWTWSSLRSSQRVRSGLARCRTGTRWALANASTSRRNRLPIFSITAGDAMGWPRCRQNWLTLAADLHVGDVGIQVEAVDAGEVEADVTVEHVVDVHHAGHPQMMRARGPALPARQA